MRFDGLLVEWSDAHGRGRVQADQGGDPLAVEASAFVDDAGRPVQGQAVSFEVRLGEGGFKDAVEVRRARADAPLGPGAARPSRAMPPTAAAPPSRGVGPLRRTLGVLALAGFGFVAVQTWHSRGADDPSEAEADARAAVENDAEASLQGLEHGRLAPAAAPRAPARETVFPQATSARCDGRTHCSQMRSCAEARWFLTHCPGTTMDGDLDGIPCEQQWCGVN